MTREARSRSAIKPLLYAGFFATGVAFALPGVLLPLLLTRWHWDDRHGGWLLFAIATGSLLGPLAVGRRRLASVACGYALVTVAALGWSFAWVSPQAAMHDSLFFFAPLWGLGLSLAMTGISLENREAAPDAAVRLLRLNFLWSAGAVSAPLLALAWLRRLPGVGLLDVVAAVFLLFAGLTAALVFIRSEDKGATDRHRESLPRRGVPFALVLATAIATGVEASAGGWLAAYAGRLHFSTSIALSATACFWAGLLVSRSFSWRPRARAVAPRSLRGLLLLVCASALCLVLSVSAATLLAGSFLLGMGLGPLYPEFLARVLALRETRLIFVAAGVASAVMPWLTGQLSSSSGSLRTGFLVPLAGAGILLATGWASAAIKPPSATENRPSA